jgi:hypothetical protein
MTRVLAITEHWSGLCRKPPAVHPLKAGIVIMPEPAHEGLPDGGGGGPGAVFKGIGSALTAMRTLNRNRQLLWFTLLAGLVLVGNAIGQAAFWFIECNLHMDIYWIVWQFFIEFATMFCAVFLLAGLYLSIPREKTGSGSFFAALTGAKKYLGAIFLWSLILALAGMLIVVIFSYVPTWFPTNELLFLYRNGFGEFDAFIMVTLSQFPFNLTLRPDIFTWIPGLGGRSVLLWIYFGFRDALLFMAINLLLFILTLFVIPSFVIGRKPLREAVVASFNLMKKTWARVIACIAFLGAIVSVVFLTNLLVGAAYRGAAPSEIVNYSPSLTWIAAAFVYDFALFCIALVVVTIGCIAVLDFYAAAKPEQGSGSPKPEHNA